MPGIQDFTYFNWGKEATRGTPVPPTRQFIGVEGTGVLGEDLGLNFHEEENRGRRSNIGRVTAQTEDVNLKVATVAGATFDDFVLPLTQCKGGLTGVGGAADKTWTAAPSMTALNNPEAFSVDVGDDVQNWRVQYAMARAFKVSSGKGDITQLSLDMFGQRSIKTAKATPAAPASSPKIPGDLWTVKFAATFAGLTGASVVPNFLLDWELEVITGLVWRHYQDGNMYGAQHVETSFAGTLTMTVESTALAVSEFYDKWKAQTVDYVRLKATSPVVLGGTFPSLQFDLPIVFANVEPIASEDEGINLYTMTANLYDDGTNPIVNPTLVCSLAAIP